MGSSIPTNSCALSTNGRSARHQADFLLTTDVDQFFANYDAFIGRLAEAGCRHTGSLIGVARLAFPEMMVEIEATAVA